MTVSLTPKRRRSTAIDKPTMFRDLLLSLSLANLCFLNVWVELTSTSLYYFRKLPPRGSMIVAAVANVLLLAMLIWAVAGLIRRSQLRWAKTIGGFGFLIFLLVPAITLRTSFAELSTMQIAATLGARQFKVLLVITAITFALLAVRKTVALVRFATAVVLILLPLLPIMLAQAIWTHSRRPPDVMFGPAQRLAPGPSSRTTRILWMLFDEWDYHLAFEQSVPRRVFPAVDRIRTEAVNATHAVGGGYGIPHALPSLIAGRAVVDRQDAGPNDLLIRLNGSQDFSRWSTQPSLFSRLQGQRWTTAVVGWYHAYCRVLGAQIDICSWEAGASVYDRPEYSQDLSLLASMQTLAQRQISKLPILSKTIPFRKDIRQRELQTAEYLRIREATRTAIGSADFVFIHWPVPHPFGIYDRSTGRIGPHSQSSYLDNLVLADRTIGEVRDLLEQQGRWDDTTVILSSDHSLRVHEWRFSGAWTPEEAQATGNERSPYVPFIVKLAGQREGQNYAKPFSMLLTHDLILSLARGEIKTSEELMKWFDVNRGRFSVPARR